jgi:hypothetical protein
MGSLGECRIEGFICRLCSTIDRNVIHIYSDEGNEIEQIYKFSLNAMKKKKTFFSLFIKV